MKVEREIAGFALPFAAGIMAATLPIWHTYSRFSFASVLIPVILSIPLAILMHPCHKSMSPRTVKSMVSAAAILCGLMTGLAGGAMEISSITSSGDLFRFAARCGKTAQETINSIPFSDHKTNALLNALLTGERHHIPEDIVTSFRKSGASHILALSGLHLGIIYGIVRILHTPLGNSPVMARVKSSSAITICTIYAFATGAGPSIVRALIFIMIREISSMAGRYVSLKQSLLVSLIIHLTLSPMSIKSAGFQLSYAAMAGITFIYPEMKSFWPDSGNRRHGILHQIWNTASMSISCQLTTAPLAWLYFRSLPEYFILTNMIALPLTGIIIPSAIITVILFRIGVCPEIMTRATESLVKMLTAALETISAM